MSNSWFALLGREWKLAAAELAAVLGSREFELAPPFAIGQGTAPDWDRLGGVVRAGSVLATAPGATNSDLAHTVIAALPTSDKKLVLGLTAPDMPPRRYLALSKLVKTIAKESGLSLRVVRSQRGNTLNAGELEHNKVLEKGLEIVLWPTGNVWTLGRTTWVQDVHDYHRRDRGRPVRDARVGMLPPKLAQMMINLAGAPADHVIYDPFCGTGVVLQEAMQLGYSVAGSDLSSDMVKATQTNLGWFASHVQTSFDPSSVTKQDAVMLKLADRPHTIVCEGWLGSPHLQEADESQLRSEAFKMNEFYKKVLAHWHKLPSVDQALIAFPVWYAGERAITLPLLDDLGSLGYDTSQFAPFTDRRLIYHRPGQTVGRMIVKLRKISNS